MNPAEQIQALIAQTREDHHNPELIAALPREFVIWPPGYCPCFEGMCRGGEVINGPLANGWMCKAAMSQGAAHGPL